MKWLLVLAFSTTLNACPETIGMMANNPGNITISRAKWHGSIGRDAWKHVRFKRPEDGLFALRELLAAYKRKHKIDTLERLTGRWVGHKHTSQENLNGYYRCLAQHMGHSKRKQKFDFEDLDTAKKLAKAITIAENGCAYPDALYDKVFSKDYHAGD